MPSMLTRDVFRRLIANKPIIHSGCMRRRYYNALTACSNHTACSRALRTRRVSSQVRHNRTFFNLDIFRSKEKDPMERRLAPGIQLMMDLVRLQRLRARLPTQQDIAEALESFFRAKLEASESYLEDTQAQLALNSLRYCIGAESKISKAEGSEEALVSNDTLTAGATVSRRTNPHGHTEDHVELARLLSEELALRSPQLRTIGALSYCAVLAFAQQPARARQLIIEFEQEAKSDQLDAFSRPLQEGAWLNILKGFALQKNEAELNATLQLIRERNLGGGLDLPSTMLLFYIGENSSDRIREWWSQYYPQLRRSSGDVSTMSATADTLIRLVTWCAAKEDLEFGHDIVRQLVQENPSKAAWDAVFLWAAATGKGVDEVGRMFGVMEQANSSRGGQSEPQKPDIATINHLVEYAISRKDPYTAERFIALGRERGISPNRWTYVLQIDYRLDVKDFDGALAAYKALQIEEIEDKSDVPAVNRLIVALCSNRRHDFDTIMNVVADLAERQTRFEAETVAALALLHMERHELHDVVDLLNTHAFSFSKAEREYIRNAMVAFCLDESQPVGQSWDCYSILRQIFDEIARDQRTQIMNDFLKRGRADMAVHVFNHMRQHSRTDTIPTIDTYVSAFLGIANVQDDESLEVVHNQLKLDFHINANTRLRNALIISYTKCHRPRKALQFWDDIVASKEGPNHSSLHIAFRACERAPFGDLKAQEIWNRLRKMKIELDKELWASFAAAIAGNGKHTEAMSILDKGEADGEIEVDAFMIGSLFAATSDNVKQIELEAWATRHHPAVWEELNKLGVEHDLEYETKSFKIDRTVAP